VKGCNTELILLSAGAYLMKEYGGNKVIGVFWWGPSLRAIINPQCACARGLQLGLSVCLSAVDSGPRRSLHLTVETGTNVKCLFLNFVLFY